MIPTSVPNKPLDLLETFDSVSLQNHPTPLRLKEKDKK